MASVSFESLSFTYPDAGAPALDDVSFCVPSGGYALVVGRSGSGKSTLLRHLKPALAPHGARRGRVLLDGVPVEGLASREQASRVAYVMQNPAAQVATDTVWHELALGLENLGTPPDLMRLRVAETASFFGIEGWFHRACDTLSGGQLQLVNLAAAMALAPEVLVLDEPTAQLDPLAATDLLAAVSRVNEELGCTVLMGEHRLEDVFATADQVLVLEGGRLAWAGEPGEVACSLLVSGDSMACALPVPTRVWADVELGGHGVGAAEKPPLSVRAGRSWLRGRVDAAGDARLEPAAVPSAPAAAPAPVEPALELRDVWYRYDRDGDDVLRGLDLAAFAGEVHAVLGGNGAGKSTALRIACGVVRPQRGRVRAGSRKAPRRVALLPQDPLELFGRETLAADLAEMPAARDADLLDSVVAACGVADLLERHPFDLSGGEVQRAALAKALLARPEVLLLDEPTKGVDAAGKEGLAALLHGLAARGVAVVLASHDVEFCARHADRATLLFDGQVAACGTPAQVFGQADLYTTAARRMSRGVLPCAVTEEEVVAACRHSSGAAV
jgi:energy-coupling factor transport system ATP-binding protein